MDYARCMNTIISKTLHRLVPPAHLLQVRRHAGIGISVAAISVLLGACGGSGGGSGIVSGDAGDIAQDDLSDLVLADPVLQDDMQSCAVEIDIADFFLTETDRQWSCEISSVVGTRFDEVFFDRSGTANFASTGIWLSLIHI